MRETLKHLPTKEQTEAGIEKSTNMMLFVTCPKCKQQQSVESLGVNWSCDNCGIEVKEIF